MKKTVFDHHPVMITKGLLATGEDWAGQTMLEPIPALLTSGLVGSGLSDGMGTFLLVNLCVAESIDVPAGAAAVILEIDVQDSGAAGAEAYLAFGYGGYINLTDIPGRSFPVYCAPANDRWITRQIIVPITDDAILDYLAEATGANTLDYRIKLIGWIILGEAYTKPTSLKEDLSCGFIAVP